MEGALQCGGAAAMPGRATRASATRRDVLRNVVCAGLGGLLMSARPFAWSQGARGVHFSVADFDRSRILKCADEACTQPPLVLMQQHAPGRRNPQMFYSEKMSARADRGEATGVSPFAGHADLLGAMNRRLSALTAAWRLTGDAHYFQSAAAQLRAWFVDDKTRMLPTLDEAGVRSGVTDDRDNGVRDTVALAESVRAASFLCASPLLPEKDAVAMRAWCVELLRWFTESKKGTIARQTRTLEAICWTMQAAELARFTRDDASFRACSHLFRDGLLRQMHFDGYFPEALHDANPYAASMFMLECMAAACESLSTPFESLWTATLPDGRGMHSAVAWALPFLRDRGKWPYVSDREYFKQQPVRENALLFAGRAYDQMDYIDVWKALPADFAVEAIARAHPVTQPALWATRPPA